jgi:predicted CXXCH cytochrome family protein
MFRSVAILLTCCLVLFISVGLLTSPHSGTIAAPGPRAPSHVSTETCAACHKPEHKAWQKSHHSWALRHATSEHVLADFNNTEFTNNGVRSTFYRRDGKFYIKTNGSDGKQREFQIRYAVGVTPLQQYLVELEGGKLQALDVAWDTKAKRWFHLYPKQDTSASSGMHWTGAYKNWNARCADCHQTNFKKNYSPTQKQYSSTWSELTIGCEACHGAGEAHLAWTKLPKTFNAAAWRGVNTKGLVTKKQTTPKANELATCSKCHSRRGQFGSDSPPPTDDLHDHYRLSLLREGLYHADGQINDEVYVLGSFLQSKMHAKGVTCSNCHEPHSGQLIANGNAVCTQCHNPAGRDGFPSLPKKVYDSKEHHHHDIGTPGAACVSCHMPDKKYMVVDPRRDHSFRIPRPDLSVKINTPNACASCHADKSNEWAAAAVKQWYPNGRHAQPHIAEQVHAHRTRPSAETTAALLKHAADSSQPAILRASALAELRGRIGTNGINVVKPLLEDKSPLVRAEAVRALQGAPSTVRARYLIPMMSDSKQVVRQAAVQATLNLKFKAGRTAQVAIAKARGEFQKTFAATSDFPETQMRIAGVAMTLRNLRAAERALLEAVRMDTKLVQAWITRGRIASALRQPKNAISILRQGADANPKSAPIHQALGRAYARERKFEAAISSFTTARSLKNRSPELTVDLARAFLGAGRPKATVNELIDIVGTNLETPPVLELLAVSLAQTGDLKRASEVAQRLTQVYPNYPKNQAIQTLLRYKK